MVYNKNFRDPKISVRIKKEIPTPATTWMNLKDIMPSEKSQT